MDVASLDHIVKFALCEDLSENFGESYKSFSEGKGIDLIDITSNAIIDKEEGEALITAKSEGVISGISAFRRVFELIDPTLRVTLLKKDGSNFEKKDKIALLKGKIKSILIGERTALNFLGHLSGIATEVKRLTDILKGRKINVLDTRKTIPGLRALEKEAVSHGGGMNHRMGLFDMVLIKDNHIDSAGSITAAVDRVRNLYGKRYKIEVETRSISEVNEALSQGVDRIMLDNMKKRMIRRAVKIIDRKAEVEVSGNMNRRRIKRLRLIPIDYISVGYITNAAGHADFSLKLK